MPVSDCAKDNTLLSGDGAEWRAAPEECRKADRLMEKCLGCLEAGHKDRGRVALRTAEAPERQAAI